MLNVSKKDKEDVKRERLELILESLNKKLNLCAAILINADKEKMVQVLINLPVMQTSSL